MYELNAYGWYTGRDKYEDAVHQAIWMRDHCVHKTDYEVRKALNKEYKKYGVLDDPYLCIIWAIAFSKRSGVYEFLKRKAIEGVKREKAR